MESRKYVVFMGMMGLVEIQAEKVLTTDSFTEFFKGGRVISRFPSSMGWFEVQGDTRPTAPVLQLVPKPPETPAAPPTGESPT